MALHIHNNLSKQKELFTPIDANRVRLYVCGMTVYDHCHIGHARVLVVFDIVYRHLRQIYGDDQVIYVRNITDIDDNIIQRAKENGEPFEKLTNRYIELMHHDADALGVLRPDKEPRATAYISEIVAMIAQLVEKGVAYCGDNGDVFYSVSTFENYGQLSGKILEDLQAGQRVAVDENKRDPMDFVLWKAAKPNEPNWPSPWGQGRPGWHIECSAMSTHCLGNHFDIHGGGLDLQFPHHENEIAQSEAATGETFVNVWMHNAFVKVDDEKMSKSLGNFFTIRAVLEHYHPEVIRFFILTSHYRSGLNYSDSHLNSAKAALCGLYTALRGLKIEPTAGTSDNAYLDKFNQAMDDDFNTPEAMAVLFELARNINKERDKSPEKALQMAVSLKQLASRLGLLQADPDEFLQSGNASDNASDLDNAAIEAQIKARQEAKKNKDFAAADQIRQDLDAAGIVLEDSAQGTTWRRK